MQSEDDTIDRVINAEMSVFSWILKLIQQSISSIINKGMEECSQVVWRS